MGRILWRILWIRLPWILRPSLQMGRLLQRILWLRLSRLLLGISFHPKMLLLPPDQHYTFFPPPSYSTKFDDEIIVLHQLGLKSAKFLILFHLHPDLIQIVYRRRLSKIQFVILNF